MNKTLKYSLIGLASLMFVGGAILVYKKRRGISKVGRKAIDLAKEEFEAWNKDDVQRKEKDSSMMANIKKYWNEGTDTFWSESRMVSEAWSAAFISYLMKKAGAGDDFKRSNSHSVYIRQSIKNRKEENENPFKGYKPNEVEVSKGDLVCFARQSGVGYDTTGAYKSHCDLVIDVKDNKATSIGGNVSNSVSKTIVELD
ncbi:MAG: DUF2272 domain-containing protein, partial [Promethearchaeota archaeon]